MPLHTADRPNMFTPESLTASYVEDVCREGSFSSSSWNAAASMGSPSKPLQTVNKAGKTTSVKSMSNSFTMSPQQQKMNLYGSFNKSTRGSQVIKKKRGVVIDEGKNNVLEISTRAVRVGRGDLDMYYSADYEPEQVIDCALCSYEAENEDEAGTFRIYNLPDGGWRLLCAKCSPPDDSWVFDRTVAVVDALLPPEMLQLVFLFLTASERDMCAAICQQWNEISWAQLQLKINKRFNDIICHSKFQHVNVLRVDFQGCNTHVLQEKMTDLVQQLDCVSSLKELQVLGANSTASVRMLATSLLAHQCLSALDVSGCTLDQIGLQAIIDALKDGEFRQFSLVLPRNCVDSSATGPGTNLFGASDIRRRLGVKVKVTFI